MTHNVLSLARVAPRLIAVQEKLLWQRTMAWVRESMGVDVTRVRVEYAWDAESGYVSGLEGLVAWSAEGRVIPWDQHTPAVRRWTTALVSTEPSLASASPEWLLATATCLLWWTAPRIAGPTRTAPAPRTFDLHCPPPPVPPPLPFSQD